MKRAVCVLAWAAISSNVWAQDGAKDAKLSDPVEILKKADEASKPVHSYRYTATAEGLFAEAERSPKVTGKLAAMPAAEGKQAMFRCEAKLTRPGSSDVEEVITGCDGENYYVIDGKNKKVYVDLDPAVMGSFRRTAGALRMQEYGHATPFSDEINGKVTELKGVEKVGDEECYHVYVEYGAQAGGLATDWYFSTKDFLPRRSDRVRTNAETGQKGGGKLAVTNLEVNPKLEAKDFKLTVPEGYTKVEDFAP
jgi:outer membrane lipoprotein-sorting protein